MKPRRTTALYQTAARIWLTLAAAAFVLPAPRRLGLWLPLHLALAGAVGTAISGAMQTFMATLTATPSPPSWATRAQFALLGAGTTLVAIGRLASLPDLVAAGGIAYAAALGLLGWMLWRAWRRSLTRRHPLPIAAYAGAVITAGAGVLLGALMGSGALSGEAYVQVKHAHLTLNVLGFASLTVVGTLITLLPTALRVRVPPFPGRAGLGMLIAGLVVQLVAWDLSSVPLLVVGALAYAGGTACVVWLVVAARRAAQRWDAPVAALHMMAGVGWFVAGSIGLVVALLDGGAGLDAYRPVFLLAFVAGWLVQVLLGAWSYLLPMARPGHPEERKRWLASFEVGARTQVLALNAGLIVLAGGALGWWGGRATFAGAVLAWLGAGSALLKAWLFPWLARLPIDPARARGVWGA